MHKRFRLFTPIVVAGVTALLLSGCGGLAGPEPAQSENTDGGYMAEIEAAALKEGELTIYSSAAEDVVKAQVDAFMAAYPGIIVSTFRSTGGELFNRYASEAEAGAVAADILAPSVNPGFLEDSGYFMELTPELIPNLATWPKDFVYPHHVAVAVVSTVVTYNTETVPKNEVPTSWEDLLDPKWAGQALMMDPRSSDGYLSLYEVLRQKFGDQYLKDFAAQGFTPVSSGATAAQEVAAGAYKLAIGNYGAHSKDLLAQGAPIGLVTDLDPTQGTVHAAAISIDAPHPNAAKLYVNWYLTKSAQQVTCAGVYSPVKESLPGCPSLPPHNTSAIWDISASERAELYSLLGLE